MKTDIDSFLNEIGKNIRNNIVAVGVSTVGTVSRSEFLLRDIAIKGWGNPGSSPIINFENLFHGILPNIPDEKLRTSINIYNDTTATCLLEWKLIPNKDINRLLYIKFGEGVNAGFVVDGKAPFSPNLHTELGHVYPRPHALDRNFDPAETGCRIHAYCFEGLASATRIRNSWAEGKDVHLSCLPFSPPWRTIAYYMAQMCWNGVLAFAPERILIGGSTMFPEILPYVRKYFRAFRNGGYADGSEGYPFYTIMRPEDEFIQMTTGSPDKSGIDSALELGRLNV